MRKLAMATGLSALMIAAPALAGGKAGASPPGSHAPFQGGFFANLAGILSRTAFSTPPGFDSPGRHYGWFRGRHLGWFKHHNPHFPHQPPPVSP